MKISYNHESIRLTGRWDTQNKDFATADSIRDELLAKGIKLIDTREGTTYELI